MKDPSIVSLHLFSFLFLIMKTSNLCHFIIAPTPAQQYHMYDNFESIRQQIRHGCGVAAVYIWRINLITGAKGDIFIVSPTCHYHWQPSTQHKAFLRLY